MPGTIAYCRLNNIDVTSVMDMCQRRHHRLVFLLDCLPIHQDSIQLESDAMAEKIGQLIK